MDDWSNDNSGADCKTVRRLCRGGSIVLGRAVSARNGFGVHSWSELLTDEIRPLEDLSSGIARQATDQLAESRNFEEMPASWKNSCGR